jgi:hypothetical protein
MSCPNCRRAARKTSWIVPGIMLVLMPKCPICLAAYIALVTGISIPIAAAAWLRGSLIALCVLLIIFILWKNFFSSSGKSLRYSKHIR